MKHTLDQELFELIEAYLQNELSEEERSSFELRLSQEPDLREEVEVMKENVLAVELGAFSNSFGELSDEYQKKNPWIGNLKNNGISLRSILSIAAGIAVLLGAFFLLNTSEKSIDSIYTKHYTIDPGLPVVMGATDNYKFNDAMVDYKAGQYEKALEKWQVLRPSNQLNDTIDYYIASAHLAMGDESNALKYLEPLSLDINSAFQDKSQWYLALAYIKLNRIEEFKAIEIEENTYYSDRINQLRADLDPL